MANNNNAMTPACRRFTYLWETCEFPNAHRTDVSDYDPKPSSLRRPVPSSGTYKGKIIKLEVVLYTMHGPVNRNKAALHCGRLGGGTHSGGLCTLTETLLSVNIGNEL